jgi:hypothetical protein
MDTQNPVNRQAHRARFTRPQRAAPRAREDRDLRCLTWPFTAPQAVVAAARGSGEQQPDLVAAGLAGRSPYAPEDHAPMLTHTLHAGLVAGSGGRTVVDDGDARLDDAIAIAASEARGRAERAAVTEVGPGTIEQLTADVIRLSRAYVSAPPLPLFATMDRELGRIHAVLDQRVYPAQARDLNFLAGVLCGLMANACLDLGREEAADDLGPGLLT